MLLDNKSVESSNTFESRQQKSGNKYASKVADKVVPEITCSAPPVPSGGPVQNCSVWTNSVKMRINWLLGLGIVLGLVGASLMVAFGVLYVKPYMQVSTMKRTTCITWNITLTDEVVRCTCASSDGGASCLSRYPCVKVWVNYTTKDGVLIKNSTLYDSHETFLLQRPAQQCSYHKCSRDANDNIEAVRLFTEDKGETGKKFPCFYEPSDLTYTIRTIVTTNVVIHCMLWPALAFIIGSIVLFAHVCDWGQRSNSSPGSSPFNSLEKPWLRHVERNYEKVGTLSEHNRDEDLININAHDNAA